MPQIYILWRKAILLPLLLFFAVAGYSQAQVDTTLTPRYIATGPNSNGFYEYLPKGYVEGSTETYPLIVSLHGLGELGNGTTQLPNILDNGIPMYITQHQFPESVTVNGKTSSFIVILPQFVIWPVATDVDAVITYALQHYRVDQNRVYLTGLSMGGGGAWAYATYNTSYPSKLAALFVVAGAMFINQQEADNIAITNLPVFATHNLNDPTVTVQNTINNINLINSAVPPPAIKAIDTIFDASGHDAWTKSYNPQTIYSNGLNAYQWMLQYSRSISVPLPLELTSYTATLAPDGATVNLNWTTATEQNNRYFILQRSGDGKAYSDLDTVVPASPNSVAARSYAYVDQSPPGGQNFYRLTQVDENGATNYYGIREVSVVTVGAAKSGVGISPNPCTDQIFVQLADPAVGSLDVSIIDAQGRVLRRWTAQKQSPDWSGTFTVSDLPPGQYFLRLAVGSQRRIQAFIKL